METKATLMMKKIEDLASQVLKVNQEIDKIPSLVDNFNYFIGELERTNSEIHQVSTIIGPKIDKINKEINLLITCYKPSMALINEELTEKKVSPLETTGPSSPLEDCKTEKYSARPRVPTGQR